MKGGKSDMEEKSIHREWVKNAAIAFLSVLLVLTFFSNTIMNRTLPEVAAKQVVSDSITALVRTSGKVVADGSYEVKAEQTRAIRSVMVKAGDEVNTGDVLFVLGEGDSEELEAAQDTLRTLQSSYQRAAVSLTGSNYSVEEREIANTKKKLEAAEKTLNDINKKIDEESNASQDIREAAKEKADDAKLILDNLTERRVNDIANKEAEMQAKWAAYETAHTVLVNMQESGVAEDSEEYIAALEADASAEATYQSAKTEYANLVNNPDPAITAAQSEYDAAKAAFDRISDPTGKYRAEKEAAEQAVSDIDDKLLALKSSLAQKRAQDEVSAQLTYIELSDIGAQIERQKKKISELSGGGENEITAQVSGVVQSVNITAGNKAQKGDVICVIEVPDLGYSLTATVSSDQARRLRVGDTATVSNYYWGSQIVATLKSIQNDPKNPQQSKLLNFSLEGDVNAGSELKLSVGSKSASYDTVLPNSAIRSDSNGSFVLVIQEKSSPLGNRYIAVRQPVEVLASDDTNSAVTGGVEAGEFVITTSSRPINAGDQVRMAD